MAGRVVIVGKPNVGKSRLFNRLSGERHSVVVDEKGITRDRVTLEVNWLNRRFLLTDTGGYTSDSISFRDEINRQVEIALRESDLVLFVVSHRDGIDGEDMLLAKLLKRRRIKNILLVANKFDGGEGEEDLGEYRLGFGSALRVSAEHGINTGILLEEIVKRLDLGDSGAEEDPERLKICIIGRPNVGKSTLVNALYGEERIITSDVAGTTRDAIDLDIEFAGRRCKIIDTPGIKRHASIGGDEKEKYSLLRSKKAIARSNMVLFVLDISEPISELDERVGGLLHKANIPTVIVANKWDLVEDRSDLSRRELEKAIRGRFRFLSWAPIVFVSSRSGQKLESIFGTIGEIEAEINKDVDEALLANFLHKIKILFAVPKVGGRRIKILSISRVRGQVPTFLIGCDSPDHLHFSYSRMVENQIRSSFGYRRTPITVIYKKIKNS